MTNFADLIQIALQTEAVRPFAALILFILIAVTWNTTGEVWRFCWQVLRKIKSLFPKIGFWNAVKCAVFVIFVSCYWQWLSLQIQYIETRYLNPVTSREFSGYSSDHVTAIYEAELRRHVDDYEFRIIQDSVRAMSLLFGCDSSAIYEAALPECGLNPFVIRRDGVAAGWIQFTNAGCKGLPFTLDHIKTWCKTRNTAAIMSATRQYLGSRSHNRHIKTGLDVYICVFAPAFLGCPAETAMYSAPSIEYQMNKSLDGWTVESGRIVRSPGAMDGKITVGELGLWMNYHKGQLIRKSLLKNL